jgi:segregation and condensation protein A
MDDALVLDLDGWEGPLDLLLTLARSQKVDLRHISILTLVEQYLAVIVRAQAVKLEVAADWLVMAAWLAYLKSALLLPREPGEEPDAEWLAMRLQVRLERLAAMRDAGARLMARDRLGRDVFARDAPEGLRTERRVEWQTDYFTLLAGYGRVTARARPVLHVVAHRAVMTLDEAMTRLSAAIGTVVAWEQIETFLPAADPALRRSALASTFLAALELARQGRVAVRQEQAFAPLYLRTTA